MFPKLPPDGHLDAKITQLISNVYFLIIVPCTAITFSPSSFLYAADVSPGAHSYGAVHGEGGEGGGHEQMQWPALTGMDLFPALHTSPQNNQALITLPWLPYFCLLVHIHALTTA